MRKLFYYSLLCLLWVSIDGCKDDEAASPAEPSFTVDKTSGLSGSTEFTFTVNQVDAQSISLLPYGTANASSGGILISSFTNGKATVKFTYGRVGSFDAVVVANNHTTDGNSIKNAISAATKITISSNAAEISGFDLGIIRKIDYNETEFAPVSTKTTIDKTAKTIDVVVGYALTKNSNNAAYLTDLTKLVAKFSNSASSTVTVNGVAQKSGETVGNFSGPLNYVVTANDGTTSTYKVTVTKTPVQTTTTIKAFSGIAGKKGASSRAMPASVDNTNQRVVIYDVYGTAANQFDSLLVKYELDGSFAILKQNSKTFDAGKAIFDLTPAKDFVVYSQDSTSVSGKATYKVYAAEAPKLTLKITAPINPAVSGTTKDFGIGFNVLTDSDLTAATLTGEITLPAGVNVTGVTFVGGGGVVVLTPGTGKIDLAATGVKITNGQKCELTVDTGTYTYKVVYTISITSL